ncbi:cyclic nucleotide-binding domain-containing protein [uncultured Roseobacter sp.]|uniref:Crp/Fnr family transcriptional regulator n=1 Tax=uncultured Roseobacter sp. TaxID=114847 RepID=UPI002637EA92|nr:cyclic nucleotide-binding domain-containing protein [uncultured Roseobacter sp.]
MLMRSITYLRILVIASAFVAIAYDTIWLKDPVGVFWESLLVLVNIVQISREWFSERRVRFTPYEQKFVSSRLRGVSKKDAKRLLNLGRWVDGAPGTVLTTEGDPVPYVVYLVTGRVDILCSDVLVGTCGPGNFVGEMSILAEEPASATAIVAEPSHYWIISSEKLRVLQDTDPQVSGALDVGIARDLRRKIIAANAERSGQV